MFAFLLLINTNSFGQKLDERRLNLYKPGKTKVVPFRVGDELTFQMKGFEHFYNLRITDLRGDSIIFGDGVVRLDQIAAVKVQRGGYANYVSKTLYVFGASWLLWTGVDDVMGNDPSWIRAGIIAGTAGALGLVAQLLSRPKIYKIDDKRFLRILLPNAPLKVKPDA
jgi:hypothetical protein